MKLEDRVALVEEAILLMKDLLLSHNGRFDNYQESLRESREDFEFKLNALIDAQMKNEAEIAKLNESTSALRDASQSQLSRIEKQEKT